MTDISKLHRALKRVKYKEDKKPNINKILTAVSFILAIVIGGFFFIQNNPEVTGFAVATAERSNTCTISQEVFSLANKNFLRCSVVENKKGSVEIRLNNQYSQFSKGVKIKQIQLNSCVIDFETIIKPGSSEVFNLTCGDKSLRNKLIISYEDIKSGLNHKLTGSAILI